MLKFYYNIKLNSKGDWTLPIYKWLTLIFLQRSQSPGTTLGRKRINAFPSVIFLLKMALSVPQLVSSPVTLILFTIFITLQMSDYVKLQR